MAKLRPKEIDSGLNDRFAGASLPSRVGSGAFISQEDRDRGVPPVEILLRALRDNDFQEASALAKFDPAFAEAISDPRVQFLAEQALPELYKADSHRASAFSTYLRIDPAVVESVVRADVEAALRSGSVYRAVHIVSDFLPGGITLESAEDRRLVVAEIQRSLRGGDYWSMTRARSAFHLQDAESELAPMRMDAARAVLRLCDRGAEWEVGALIHDFKIDTQELIEAALQGVKAGDPVPQGGIAFPKDLVSHDINEYFSSKERCTERELILFNRLFPEAAPTLVGVACEHLSANAETIIENRGIFRQLLPQFSDQQSQEFFLKLDSLIKRGETRNAAELAELYSSRRNSIEWIQSTLEELPKKHATATSYHEIAARALTQSYAPEHQQNCLAFTALGYLPLGSEVQRSLLDSIRGRDAFGVASTVKGLIGSDNEGARNLSRCYAAVARNPINWVRDGLIAQFTIGNRWETIGPMLAQTDARFRSIPLELRVPVSRYLATGAAGADISSERLLQAVDRLFARCNSQTIVSNITATMAAPHNPSVLVRVLAAGEPCGFESKAEQESLARCLRLSQQLQTLLTSDAARRFSTDLLSKFGKDFHVDTLPAMEAGLTKAYARIDAFVNGKGSIGPELLARLQQGWGTVEPILTFLDRMKLLNNRGVANYFSELVTYFDPSDRDAWKAQRYDLENSTVKAQIGHLSPEQLEEWKKDHIVDIARSARELDAQNKPGEILAVLKAAAGLSGEADLAGRQDGSEGRWREILRRVIGEVPNPEVDSIRQRARKEARQLNGELVLIDAVIEYQSLPNLLQARAVLGSPEKQKAKALKFAAAFVARFLDPALAQNLDNSVKNYAESKAQLLTTAMEAQLASAEESIRGNFRRVQNASFFTENGIELEERDAFRSVLALRKDLKAGMQMAKLCALTPKLIAQDRLDSVKKNSGAQISDSLRELAKYFDSTPMAPVIDQLKNIVSSVTLEHSTDRLVGYDTDNPQILLQVGKYPLDCGSCQNYESTMGYNVALPSIIGDAHIKAALVVDVSRLPHEVQKAIDEQGLTAGFKTAHPQDILKATVARSLEKIGTVETDKPALVIAPGYTSNNKRDRSMNYLITLFSRMAYYGDGFDIRRPGTSNTTTAETKTAYMPRTRNEHGGHYEDAFAMGNRRSSYTVETVSASKLDNISAHEAAIEDLALRSDAA